MGKALKPIPDHVLRNIRTTKGIVTIITGRIEWRLRNDNNGMRQQSCQR